MPIHPIFGSIILGGLTKPTEGALKRMTSLQYVFNVINNNGLLMSENICQLKSIVTLK